jgi:hypothetical protein
VTGGAKFSALLRIKPMAKKTSRQLLISRGFDIKDDTQRAEAEAMAREGWNDDDEIVVDPAFEMRLRERIERLRISADVPPALLYKTVVRARIAPARLEFMKKGRLIAGALVAALALCNAMEALGDPPNVYWAHFDDVSLFRKVIGELPSLIRLRDDLEPLAAQFKNFKHSTGRPRDYEKTVFQRFMVSLLPDRLQKSGRRFDREFSELYEMVTGRKQTPESYRRTRKATTTAEPTTIVRASASRKKPPRAAV